MFFRGDLSSAKTAFRNSENKKEEAMGVSDIAKNILDLIFVPKCAACGVAVESSDVSLCDECEHVHSLESKGFCTDCLMPYTFCRCHVHYGDLSFKMFRVTGYKTNEGSVAKQMVLGLKDNIHRAAIERMTSEMVRVLKRRAPEVFEYPQNAVIVFIPRSDKARRDAGHDQSFLLAERISEKTGIELADVFISRGKRAQKTLNKEQRMMNAELSYDLLDGLYDFVGKTAIIVDDIITSGSSVGVCGGMLIGAGAENVISLVYAKTERY